MFSSSSYSWGAREAAASEKQKDCKRVEENARRRRHMHERRDGPFSGSLVGGYLKCVLSSPTAEQRRKEARHNPSIQPEKRACVFYPDFRLLLFHSSAEFHPFPPRAALPPSFLPTHRASLHAKEEEGTPLLLLLRNGASARLPFLYTYTPNKVILVAVVFTSDPREGDLLSRSFVCTLSCEERHLTTKGSLQ